MLTLELQARSIVFESGEGGGGADLSENSWPAQKYKKKSWTVFIRGGRGGGVVPKTSISISMAISLNSLYFFLKCGRPTPSLFKFLFSHIKFKKNVCCEKKGGTPPPSHPMLRARVIQFLYL